MKALFAVLISIPLFSANNWEVLTFRNIKPNQVEFTKQGLQLSIDGSASPLIYKLPQTESAFKIAVEGRLVSGKLNLPNPKIQGLKKSDDFIMRLGLVVEGRKKLSWVQKVAAPGWIKRLHSIAPGGKGIDAIYFYEVAQDASLVGTRRTHPLSELMKEEVVAHLKDDGTFQFTKTLDTPLPVLGLWISCDGDDTGSKYQVLISNIELRRRK